MIRALGALLVMSLAALRAVADFPEAVADLSIYCGDLAGSPRLEWAVEQLEERLAMESWTAALEPTGSSEFQASVLRETAEALPDILSTIPVLDILPFQVSPGELHGLAGDLLLIADRPELAMELYRRAGGHATLCSAAYDGKIYTFETYANGALTPYLLIRDPQTGRVLERRLLPTVPAAFSIGRGRLHILFRVLGYRETRIDTLSLVDGRLPFPIWVENELLVRPRLKNAGEQLVDNFIYTAAQGSRNRRYIKPEFVPRDDHDRGRPADLETLETALVRAVFQDPTEPWHRFFLGQCLWAEGRRQEAADVWRDLLGHGSPNIPYYHFMKMAWFFELYQQHEWADAAFREALLRRRRLPLPIDSSFLIERLMNTPLHYSSVDENFRPEIDPERAYLWWLRTREISGVSEGDDFRAVLWADYWKKRGEAERTAAEIAYLDRVRQYPVARHYGTLSNYVLWLVVASLSGFLFVLAVFFIRLLRRIFLRESRQPGFFFFLSRHSAMVIFSLLVLGSSLAVALFVISWGLRVFSAPLDLNDTVAWQGWHPVEETEEKDLRAALARHAVGDLEGARQRYESLPATPPVRRHLLALEKRLPPLVTTPVPRDREPLSWREMVSYLRDLDNFLSSDPLLVSRWQEARLFVTENARRGLLLLLAGLLGLCLRSLRGWLWRASAVFLPGGIFLRRGHLLRAYSVLWLFVFGAGPLAWLVVQATFLDIPHPTTGPLFQEYLPVYAGELILPPPEYDRLLAENFWSLLWVYPYARMYYFMVMLSLATALYLHGCQVRTLCGHQEVDPPAGSPLW